MTLQDFDPAQRFVAGTVGPAGQRAFYLQAVDAMRVITIAVEKQQVALLADRVNDVLDELAPADAAEPGTAGGAPEDTAPLQTPFDEDWTVQTLSLAWDEERSVIVIECHDHDPDPDPDEGGELSDGPSGADPSDGAPGRPVSPPELALARNSIRVSLTPAVARAFARRTTALVASGRPPCPFCGGPLDASGHICPRANGYKR